MPVSDEFLEYIAERFSRVGTPVDSRRMFGGAMLYAGGVPFALVADDVLYFKADDGTRTDFEDLDMSRFRPFDDKPPMNYYELPGEVLEEDAALAEWTGRALEVAARAKKGKRKRNT